jgi:hypothetical protein
MVATVSNSRGARANRRMTLSSTIAPTPIDATMPMARATGYGQPVAVSSM